jgi:hypothetical protein
LAEPEFLNGLLQDGRICVPGVLKAREEEIYFQRLARNSLPNSRNVDFCPQKDDVVKPTLWKSPRAKAIFIFE